MKNNNEIKTLEQQFAKECKLINLKYEYTEYREDEQWAIVSELSAVDIMTMYSEFISTYIPFIHLSMLQGEAISEFNNIEAKFRMRNYRYGHAFDINHGEFEEHHPEFAFEPDYIGKMALEEENKQIQEAIEQLSPVQKRRIKKYFFEEMTYKEIAEDENAAFSSVRESVMSAINNLKKILK